MKNIVVVANTYPTNSNPNFGAFVYNLMQELVKYKKIAIISPKRILKKTKSSQNYGNESCLVLRPTYFSLPNFNFYSYNSKQITSYCYNKKVNETLRKLDFKPNLIYCHFIFNAISCIDYVLKNNIPLVIASGESSYHFWDSLPNQTKEVLLKKVSLIICVSWDNKKRLTKLGFNSDLINVIPNAVDYKRFRLFSDRAKKIKTNINSGKFVVGFIGHFIDRKGPNRVIEAIKQINENEDIELICVGKGEALISNSFTKVLQPVPNSQLPTIINSFDIFVLPTLNEGHCNVIEEVKACCVPIISSKGTSVEEQIDCSTGILIDPLDITQISEAILKLKNNVLLRNKISNKLMTKRGENSLQNRAKKINELIDQIII